MVSNELVRLLPTKVVLPVWEERRDTAGNVVKGAWVTKES